MENTYTIETLLLCDAAYNNRYGLTLHSAVSLPDTKLPAFPEKKLP